MCVDCAAWAGPLDGRLRVIEVVGAVRFIGVWLDVGWLVGCGGDVDFPSVVGFESVVAPAFGNQVRCAGGSAGVVAGEGVDVVDIAAVAGH